jgi:hypothetical protein
MDPDGRDPGGQGFPERDPPLVRPYVEDPRDIEGGPEQEPASGLRPYLLTGGRVGPVDATLEAEAQVATTPAGRAGVDRLSFERRAIVLLCREPMAMAEIAARLDLHLGVVRVIVGDLIAAGQLVARRPEPGVERSVSIIERVIRGLQAIR